jgi:hypothetical protein
MKILSLIVILLSCAAAWAADEDADIVTNCLMSNAEFGTEMAQVCIKENKDARAEVARYPEEFKTIVERCKRRKEMGWGLVKKCIDDDIAAGPVLEAYAKEQPALLERCQMELLGREPSRIKLCVEMALEAQKPDAQKNQ